VCLQDGICGGIGSVQEAEEDIQAGNSGAYDGVDSGTAAAAEDGTVADTPSPAKKGPEDPQGCSSWGFFSGVCSTTGEIFWSTATAGEGALERRAVITGLSSTDG
jgi:hypothetical protein